MSTVQTIYGNMHTVPGDLVISRSLALYGEWAKQELDFLHEFIAPGAHVLDIGSYIGTHTVAFARFVGSQGKVYAFEPRQEIFRVLSSNLAENQCAQVQAFNMGVSDQSGQTLLEPLDLNSSANFGGLELHRPGIEAAGAYTVAITTIDDLRIVRVDFMKIDVEGMEKSVLDGSLKTIQNLKPAIYCECNSVDSGTRILDFAHAIGYTVFGFLFAAYSKDNFNRYSVNIFGDAKELGLLLLPPNRQTDATGLANRYPLHRVENLDAIALLLLHKPQYPEAVLSLTKVAAAEGLLYPSPLSRALQQEILVLSAHMDAQAVEIHRMRTSYSWRLTKPVRAIRNIPQLLRRLWALVTGMRR